MSVLQELRDYFGAPSQEVLDAYNPAAAVYKLGRNWSYTTLAGNYSQDTRDTKREAVAAATFHKTLKQAQFDNPMGYAHIESVRAQYWLTTFERLRNADPMAGEMELGARATAAENARIAKYSANNC